MPPRTGRALKPSSLYRALFRSDYCQSCSICRVNRISTDSVLLSTARPRPIRQLHQTRFSSSKAATNDTTLDSPNWSPSDGIDNVIPPVKEDWTAEFRAALLDLQKRASSFVNISQLQLILRGLDQGPGNETTRISVLGVRGQGQQRDHARQLLRLLLADPLQESEWERELDKIGDGLPFLLRLGEKDLEDSSRPRYNQLLPEINVTSPEWNGHKLEFLFFQADALPSSDLMDLHDAVMNPTISIPTSSTGQHTQVMVPAHRAIVFVEGLAGAAKVAASVYELHNVENAPGVLRPGGNMKMVVNLPGYKEEASLATITIADIGLADRALSLFRYSTANASAFERDWSQSKLPELVQWIKAGSKTSVINDEADEDPKKNPRIKHPTWTLIQTMLDDMERRIEDAHNRLMQLHRSSSVPSHVLDDLQKALRDWAERAHTELRNDLDKAFETRWRQLGWWKLFWRVDDVSVVSSDILTQGFLRDAEKEIIFLAGKFNGAGVLKGLPQPSTGHWAYKRVEIDHGPPKWGKEPPPQKKRDIFANRPKTGLEGLSRKLWPVDISLARLYLANETVPSLQALAQRLIAQTATGTTVSTALAGLLYASSYTTGIYEAGAVALFGIVWSLRRMQKKWETGRRFWESEVREEGRKAVRSVEATVGKVLAEQGPKKKTDAETVEMLELREAHKQLEKVAPFVRYWVGSFDDYEYPGCRGL